MRHAAADSIEIEPQAAGLTGQPCGSLIEREPAGGRLFENALVYQVPQHPV